MTNHDYLLNVINGQALPTAEDTALKTLRAEIEAVLRAQYGNAPRIYYAGSYGKKTLIKENYDLDILIYFPPETSASLKEIYFSVLNTLTASNYIAQKKNVALRLPYQGGFSIDVVPGKSQDNTYYWATLYKSETDSTQQTSIKKHIDFIKSVRNTIKLMKVWRLRQSLDWKTFAMEITVARALSGLNKGNYETNLVNVFKYVRDNIQTMKIVDPANTNNEIYISSTDRLLLQDAAKDAIAATYWSDIIW